MVYYTLKIIISAIVILAVSETGKRNTLMAALFASLPLISILSIFWLYLDTKNIEKVSALTTGILWLVLPSLVFFLTLPPLLKRGVNFYISMIIAVGLTAGIYGLQIFVLERLGIKI